MIQSDIVWLWQKLESTFPMIGMLVVFGVIAAFVLRARVPWLFKLIFGKRRSLENGDEEEASEENVEHHHKRRRRSDAVIDKFIELAKEQNKFQGQQVLLMQQLVEGQKEIADLLSSGIDRQKDMSIQIKTLYERELQR